MKLIKIPFCFFFLSTAFRCPSGRLTEVGEEAWIARSLMALVVYSVGKRQAGLCVVVVRRDVFKTKKESKKDVRSGDCALSCLSYSCDLTGRGSSYQLIYLSLNVWGRFYPFGVVDWLCFVFLWG